MNPFQTKIVKLFLLRRLSKRLKRTKKCNIRPIFLKRLVSGESQLVRELRDDTEYHKKYFRMTKTSFDYLYEKVKPDLTHKIHHKCPISPLERLAVTLRYLASGSSQTSIGISYRISPSSMSIILRETMVALCKRLQPEVLPQPTTEIWKQSEAGFSSIWNFPNCCGALDGKHVRVQCPAHSGSMNFNYKGYFSLVLLAIADPMYKFVAVDIGSSGSISDGGVFARSRIGNAIQTQKLKLPADKKVGDHYLPHVIVCDDAFPLKPNLMKPFAGKFLGEQKRVFNYRLSRARMVVEHAFGILVNRWRVLHTMIIGDLEFVKLIIRTCVILHNYLLMHHDSVMASDVPADDTLNSFESRQGSNNYCASAGDTREKFMSYFNTDGKVPWQGNVI